MITLNIEKNLLAVAVFGEFSLADYKEFEEQFLYKARFDGAVSVLFDLREMASFTIDVAWEELKFTREHSHQFKRVAVVTDSQWIGWSAWINQFFVGAETQSFPDEATARAWLAEDGAQ